MTEKEKARAYDNVRERIALRFGSNVAEEIFSEFEISDDEKIRKKIIETFKNLGDGKIPVDINYADIFTWLEKQGKQEQLYIRFGEIPTDEKSKIYQGEIEVGTENGVSVYPAFKTDEGDIVLGLILPITKTTLYTQQHLLEYDNRPCYLVKGDYVGKDTDGQPLINNVSIIEKIGTYRAKEEKQGEQKPTDKVESKFHEGDWVVDNCGYVWKIEGILNQFYLLEGIEGGESRPTIEWVNNTFHHWSIQDAKDGDVLAYVTDEEDLWLMIYWSLYEPYEGHVHYHALLINNDFSDKGTCCICIDDLHPATKEQRDLLFQKMAEAGYEWDAEKKELRLLITNGGDFFESENCEQKPAEWKQENIEELTEFENAMMHIGGSFFGENAGLNPNDTDTIKEQAELLLELAPKTEWNEEGVYNLKLILSTISQDQDLSLETKDKLTSWLKSLKDGVIPQPKQEWNKGDLEMLNAAISFVELSSFTTIGKGKNNTVAWLKSLKSRVIPQPKQEWSEEDEKNLQGIIYEIQANKNNGPSYDIPVYEGYLNWLKSLSNKK